MEAADDPAFITLLDLVSILEPLEVHIRCILDLTFQLGAVANVDFHWNNFVPERRLHCFIGREKERTKLIQ